MKGTGVARMAGKISAEKSSAGTLSSSWSNSGSTNVRLFTGFTAPVSLECYATSGHRRQDFVHAPPKNSRPRRRYPEVFIRESDPDAQQQPAQFRVRMVLVVGPGV